MATNERLRPFLFGLFGGVLGGAVVGGGIAILVVITLRPLLAEKSAQPPGEEYLVAQLDLKPGDKIGDLRETFEIKALSPGAVPPMAMKAEPIRAKPEILQGRIVRKPIAKGDVVTAKHFEDDTVTRNLETGYRALPVPIRLDPKAIGQIQPDMRVDLIGNYIVDGERRSRVFLQNIRILSVDSGTATRGAGPDCCFLWFAVKPAEAAVINLVLNQSGVISVMVRKTGDTRLLELGEIKRVLPGEEPEPKK